jgi:hypothetical protein
MEFIHCYSVYQFSCIIFLERQLVDDIIDFSSIVPPGVELDTVPSFSKSDTFSFYNGKYHTVTTDPRLTTISLKKKFTYFFEKLP